MATNRMKGSPCCAGLMRSCLHTYRTKTNLTQHIIQPLGGGISQVWGGHPPSMGGSSTNYGRGGHQPSMGGIISQVWGGHQPTMGGSSAKYGGGHQPSMGGSSTNYGGVISQVWGVINQLWGGHQPSMGGGHQPTMGGVVSHQYVQEVKIERIILERPAVCKQNGRTNKLFGEAISHFSGDICI